MEIHAGSETTVEEFSNKPKKKALGENLTSVESVERKKLTFAEKRFESYVYIFGSKNTLRVILKKSPKSCY